MAWLGRMTELAERRAPRTGKAAQVAYGAGMVGLLVGASALVGATAQRALAPLPRPLRLLILAALLKTTLSLRGLLESAETTERRLEGARLDGARASLRALVSRQTNALDDSQVASATIESLAENLADSVVGPLLFYALAGLPGAFAYRAANTLDAMIGYHGEYEQLGKAAARLDDLLNLLPARLSALLIVAAAGLGQGQVGSAWSTLWRDHARVESPNAGWPMSAAAGALQVRLEKVGHYELGVSFREPRAADIRRARRLCLMAAGLGLLVASLKRT